MKFKIQHILIALIAIIGLGSCTDTIELDLDDAKKILVVEGSMTNIDTTHWVKLSYTTNVFSSDQTNFKEESGALVTLYENGALIDTMEFNMDNERFETEKFGTIGNSYSIRIVTVDGTSYFSEEEELRREVPIDTIWTQFEEGDGFEDDAYVVYIETHEPEGKGDNYQWKTYVNGEFLSDPEEMILAPDDLVDGNDITDWDIFEMDEEDYDEYAATGSNNDVVNVRIEQASITKPYREFLQLIQEQTVRSGGLFSPPPAEIRGNVRKNVNGLERAQGYFFTATLSSKSIDVIR